MIENKFTPNPTKEDINELFQELVAHGTPLFGLSVHKTANDATRNIMIHKHWHKELEILFIEENDLFVEIGTQTFIGQQGDIFFIPGNLIHTAFQKDGKNTTFYAIVFDIAFISSFGSDSIQQQYLEPMQKHPERYVHQFKHSTQDYQNVKNVFQSIIDAFLKKEQGYELRIKSDLYEFFYLLIQQISSSSQPSLTQADKLAAIRVKKILAYIEANYALPIYIRTIAAELSLSEQYFCRFFKKYFHMSFNSYLTQYRLNRGEILLQHTDLPVIDIALATGFESANYFTVVFKKKYGITPTAYRREKQQ